MHVLVLFAHPMRQSFTGQVADKVVEGIRAAGNTAEFLDLYSHTQLSPYLSAEELHDSYRGLPPPADVQQEHDRYENADALAFIFPLWWYSCPAVLTSYIERIVYPGWAFPLYEKAAEFVPLTPKKVLTIVPAGSSPEILKKVGPAGEFEHRWEVGLLGHIGITDAKTVILHGVRDAVELRESQLERRKSYLSKCYELGKSYFDEPIVEGDRLEYEYFETTENSAGN